MYVLSIIGVASAITTIFVFSMFQSYYNNAVSNLYPSNSNTLIITEKGIPFYQVVPFGSKINQSRVAEIKSFSGVKEVFPALFLRAADVENVQAFSDTIMAIPLENISSERYINPSSLLLTGRFPNPGFREICIGVEVGNGSLTINESLDIDAINYTIVGLLKPSSILFNHIIIADINVIQEQFNYQNISSCLFVYMSSATQLPSIKEQIQSLDPTLQVITPDDIAKLSSGLLTITTLSNIFFGFFITIISVLFTILLTIKKYQNQQTELQILWELGTPSHRFLSIYFVESCIISIIGCFLGLTIGFILFFDTMYLRSNTKPYFLNVLNVAISSIDGKLILELLLFSFVSSAISILYLLFKVVRMKHTKIFSRHVNPRKMVS
ncbi:MAG TPA: ABC transporter permease [Candidatus Lokiarchaeia archaeon]|nr:ABC transporter permease [Candidatus Lokiarchaeia archaeon]